MNDHYAIFFGMSKLLDFIGQLKTMKVNAESYSGKEVRLGWADDKRESPRSRPFRFSFAPRSHER